MSKDIKKNLGILSANLPPDVTLGQRARPEYIDEEWSKYSPLPEESAPVGLPVGPPAATTQAPPPTALRALPELPVDATVDDYAAELDIVLPLLSTDQLKYIEARTRLNSDAEVGREWKFKHGSAIYQWKRSREPEVLEKVLGWLRQEDTAAATEILRRHLTKAAMVKVGGLESVDERLRQAAATELLDRALGKPMQRVATKSQQETLIISVDF